MKNIRTVSLFACTLIIGSFVLAGCLPTAKPTGTTEPETGANPAATTEKSGTTTMRGTVQVQGKTAFLKTASATVELSSYDLDLAPYNGKTVSVTGKFSGDTLFVSEITE